MAVIASEPEQHEEFEPAPEGTHIARCVQLIELGTIFNSYRDKWQYKVVIGWELPNCTKETDDEGVASPYIVWRRLTVSLSTQSHMRPMLEAWRGKSFDPVELQGFALAKILDKGCMVTVVHETKKEKKKEGEPEGSEKVRTYANVKSVVALPKGVEVPDRITPIINFELDAWDQATFDTFSEKLKTAILGSKEVMAMRSADKNGTQASEGALPDEDIPF